MKKKWIQALLCMAIVVALSMMTGCKGSDDDDSSGSGTTSGNAVPSIHDNAEKVLPLAGQASSSSTAAGQYRLPSTGEIPGIARSAIGSFTYSAATDYASQSLDSYFNGLFSTDDTSTTTIMGLIAHGEFFANDIYYSYSGTMDDYASQVAAKDSRTINDITDCTTDGAVDIEGKTVTIPYFNETVSGLECFKDASSDLPAGHDSLYNVFTKNDQSSEITFLHSKINSSGSGKQYLVFYGNYNETTHNFNLKIAQLDDKLDGDGSYDANEWRLAAKVSGNVDSHTFSIQVSSEDMQMVGKGVSEGTGARFLAGFSKGGTNYFFCIDSSAADKAPVTSTSDCSSYVSDVEQMSFLDQITSSFSVTPTYQ